MLEKARMYEMIKVFEKEQEDELKLIFAEIDERRDLDWERGLYLCS